MNVHPWRLLSLGALGALLVWWRHEPTSATQSLDPTQRILVGTWSTPRDGGATLTWVFAPDGAIRWDLDSDDFRRAFPDGMIGKFRLDRSVVPNRLDLYGFADHGSEWRYLAIAAFPADGTLVVDGAPESGCRHGRPEDFSEETMTMTRLRSASR